MTDNMKQQKSPVKTGAKTGSGKKKLVVSYKNLSPEVLDLFKEKYPAGYSEYLIKVDKGNGQFFHAVTLDTEDADYLVKVDVKIDSDVDDIDKLLEPNDNEDEFSPESSVPLEDIEDE
jgi:hypothetical protein